MSELIDFHIQFSASTVLCFHTSVSTLINILYHSQSVKFPSRPQSHDPNSECREIRGNQCADWRHNENAGRSWFLSLHSTSFAYITLSIHRGCKSNVSMYLRHQMCISQGFWRVADWSSLNWDPEVGMLSHYKWAIPRTPLQKGPSTAVLVSSMLDCCVHTGPNKPNSRPEFILGQS